MAATIAEEMAQATGFAPRGVLLVDAERESRRRLVRLLQEEFGPHTQVWEADRPQAALEIARGQPVDVALIDERTSDADELDLLDELAQQNPEAATILLTERDDPTATSHTAESGSEQRLAKRTINGRSLGRAITRAVRQTSLLREYSRVTRELHQSHDELDHFVRALSHDMSANFMLLESSFGRLAGSLEEVANPDLKELAAHVRACLDESKRFVGDLVRLAQTGRVDMEPEPVDLDKVVADVLFEQRELLDLRSVGVEVRYPLGLVWCNRHRVKQVITNLIRNALKHGCDPKDARITISSPDAGPQGSSGRFTTLRIHDNGPGITAKFHEEIFLPGVRLPSASGDGSGMGLAIVKKIVQHGGGSIRIDSPPGSGTALLVTFPQVPAQSTKRPPDIKLPPDGGGDFDRRLGHDAPHDDRPVRPHQSVRKRTGRRGHA